jgi:hypothetical protein
MAERCESMTSGERERLRQRMRKRFGYGPSNGENEGAMKPPRQRPKLVGTTDRRNKSRQI